VSVVPVPPSAARPHVTVRLLVVLCALAVLVPLVLASSSGTARADRARPGGDAWAGSTVAAHEDTAPKPPADSPLAGPEGIDISHHQGAINWGAVAGAGVKFAYMKATEGTGFTDSRFDTNYTQSYNAGLIRGAYHFALPDRSGGAAQARFFVSNGGGWSGDGKTLPPALDIEYNPYGASCYGKSQSAMVTWIREFSNEVKRLSGRYPTIYTTRDWWVSCTGNSGAFNRTNALWIARWGSSPGTLPNWPVHTFWQYTDSGSVPGVSGHVDRNVFNGSLARLQAFARCTEESPCRS
jgi:GH25 family lysozyme M1 (1,4-beta-N-acetylmuramidase)